MLLQALGLRLYVVPEVCHECHEPRAPAIETEAAEDPAQRLQLQLLLFNPTELATQALPRAVQHFEGLTHLLRFSVSALCQFWWGCLECGSALLLLDQSRRVGTVFGWGFRVAGPVQSSVSRSG